MLRDGRTNKRGFTLIEMVVTLTIFSILVVGGVPTLRAWVANAKVRAVADGLQNGIRTAQVEAMRRSRQMVFALTAASSPSVGFATVANGANWAIQSIPAMSGGTESPAIVATGVLTGVGSPVQITGGAAICFNPSGRLAAQSNTGLPSTVCALPTTGVNGGSVPAVQYSVTATGATHPLNVVVALGGQVHLCDPTQSLTSANPYGC